MTHDRTNDPPKTASELMAELHRDPEFQARLQQRELQQRRTVEAYRQAVAPLMEDLAATEVRVDSIAELRSRERDYERALPVLLRWLPRVSDDAVKEDIVRTLSVPLAKPVAAAPLISEFRNADDPRRAGLRWAIANALAVVADDTVFHELEALIKNKRSGRAREMLTLALGNMRNPRAVPLLIELLEDDETVGHAAMTLGQLKAAAARTHLESLINHPKEWVRAEVERALANLQSAE